MTAVLKERPGMSQKLEPEDSLRAGNSAAFWLQSRLQPRMYPASIEYQEGSPLQPRPSEDETLRQGHGAAVITLRASCFTAMYADTGRGAKHF